MSDCGVCSTFLESTYPALLCPSCLATELLTEASVIARGHVERRDWVNVERTWFDLGTRAEQVLLEEPAALVGEAS